ncbi:hypothetical protein FHU38_005045 [Saccharomonospora amisosensis]|uniref:Immunity protein Imm1 n=1 Tax=Saccharomonospora amisosensis TaxID=1128677 RepID=A0A7X5UUS2_9PSEU|nr:Imm1 family immunity protein [Saccharomonospora amisosensis]NIJ14644.1 hypothetical protein [Saccharomonospora amisosensis]
MNYHAAVPVGHDQGYDLELTAAADVDELIRLLSLDDAGAASIQRTEVDPVLDVQVHDRFGYLMYVGDQMYGYSVGDPDSPDLADLSEVGFPAGTGVPLERFRAALVEFITKDGALPSVVEWRPVEQFAGD